MDGSFENPMVGLDGFTYIHIEKARIFWPYKLNQMYGKYTSPMDGMGKICFKQTNWAWQVFLFG